MDSAAHDFGRSLWHLYAEAGSPDLTPMVTELCTRLPSEQAVTVTTAQSWLNGQAVPLSLDTLNAFLEQLHSIIKEAKGSAYETQSSDFWESLWLKAARTTPSGGPDSEERPHEGAPENIRNTIQGQAAVASSIQADQIRGDIHIHSAGSSPPQAPAAYAQPMVRVQNEQETIEIYDERLAHIWIRARLQGGDGR